MYPNEPEPNWKGTCGGLGAMVGIDEGSWYAADGGDVGNPKFGREDAGNTL